MNRRIKAIGLVLGAVLALSALFASAAPAASFTASSYPATVTGEQTEKNSLTIQGSKWECSKAHFEGTLAAASSSITITPKYIECVTSIGVNATMHMNSCDFQFTVEGGTTPSFTGSMHIRCTKPGDSITITMGSICTIHMPEQTPTTNKIDYTNSGGGVLVRWTVSGIHTKVVRNSFLCPFNAVETDMTGIIAGTVQLNGTGGVSLSVS